MEMQVIRQKIYEIRGQRVMLDFDLAELYGVETRIFNQAIKRNIERFPEDFMFQLTEEEWQRSLMATEIDKESESIDGQSNKNSSQNVISSSKLANIDTARKKHRGKRYLPYAFTEHGASMLAGVLRSEKAVQMSIAIVRAFIALKQFVARREGLAQQLRVILDRIDEHDVQLKSIYDAIENLLDEKAEEKELEEKWAARERIGFKK